MGERVERAVVIGGSMAGLLAARCCESTPPRGAPQGAHQHVLLPGGADVVESLLPGITVELVAAGSPVVDIAGDVKWLTPAGWAARFSSGLRILTCSRPLLEHAVRRRVGAMAGVELVSCARVTGLVADASRVRGVRLQDGAVIEGDVVVDASGRASRAPVWLQALGGPAPEETVIDADLAYAGQVIDAPLDAIPGARGAYVQVAPPDHLRGGVAFPLEDGRWLLTLAGVGGDHPPRDPLGFQAFARSLRDPVLADLLAAGSAAGPIAAYGATSNRYRHYERLRALPAGFVATGDAACAFNPIYAQGMSAAAFAAAALDRGLRRHPSPAALTRRFPRELRTALRVPCMMATAADFETAGVRPPLPVQLMNRYVARVTAASTDDPGARRRLLEVMGMRRLPQALFAPRVVASAARRRGHPPLASPVPALADA